MPRDTIVTAVDIGSSIVKVGCALLEEGSSPRLVGVGSAASVGVRRGQIIDLGEVVPALQSAFGEAERTAGARISRAQVVIGGPQVSTQRSSGSVAVSRADGEVSQEDISRVIEAAKAISIPRNREIIATIPLSFSLDGDSGLENPIGLKGVRLEIDVLLVLASKPMLRSISRALGDASYDVEQWIYSPFATARAILTKKQKEAGVIAVNMGGTMTEIAFIEERELKYSSTIPLGGVNVTNDIAVGLRVELDVAERIKLSYGSCFPSQVSKREQVVLADWGLGDLSISRYAIAQIIEKRMQEIIGAIEKEVKKFIKEKRAPAGIVFAGGGSKVGGLAEFAKKQLKLPVQIAKTRQIESDLPEAFDSAYATLMGALLIASDEERSRSRSPLENFDSSGLLRKAKGWLQELLP